VETGGSVSLSQQPGACPYSKTALIHAKCQASTAVQLRSSFFWDLTQRWLRWFLNQRCIRTHESGSQPPILVPEASC